MIRKLMWVLLVSIAVLVSLGISSQQVEAATTQYVNAKDDIFLRDAASSEAKKIATIKNHTAVSVISTSKGWSYVQVGKQKGYVYASALSKKHPKENQSITGGFSPKEGLTLTYLTQNFDSNESKTYNKTYKVKRDGDFKILVDSKESDSYNHYYYYESKDELFLGLADTDWVVAYMSYPIKKGKSYKVPQEGFFIHYKVESTTATLKVKAGTFNNVTVISSGDNRYYFVKNIGVIKITFGREVFMELTSVK